jgi:hypothetical protein
MGTALQILRMVPVPYGMQPYRTVCISTTTIIGKFECTSRPKHTRTYKNMACTVLVGTVPNVVTVSDISTKI